MKKLMVMVLAMMLVPAAAMGFQKMSEQAQSEVTGQAGVQIAVDDVKMYQDIGGLWYTDTDGLSGDDGASVGISALTANVQVEAIYKSSDADETIETPNNEFADGYDFTGMNGVKSGLETGSIKPLTIDVTSDLNMLETAGIQIQLPSVAVHQDSVSMTLSVYDDTDPLEASDSDLDNFGDVHVGETTMAITDGVVEIAPN